MNKPQILAFSGSSRTGSYNRHLLSNGIEAARAAGAEVTVVDLRELALPLFDQDLESTAGLPEGAKKFKSLLLAADGLLIASPEYNSSYTPLLKTAIDWASRVETEDEPALSAFRGKVAAICSASPGFLGGLRGLVALRTLLGNIGVLLLPEQVTLSTAHEAFSETGSLKDPAKAKQMTSLAENLVRTVRRLKS
ncbi:MAG TPA: NAD(P)H-dependent oxidoreductase [Chthoniobacterales bacterium]|jgi:NAD(P)H-dependent FMN reductase